MNQTELTFFVSKLVFSDENTLIIVDRKTIKIAGNASIDCCMNKCAETFNLPNTDSIYISLSMNPKNSLKFKDVLRSMSIASLMLGRRDLYLFPIKPQQSEKLYKPITSYSFYDDGDFVKVFLNLSGVSKNQVTYKLGERYLECKAEDFKGQNHLFRVTKTHDKYEEGAISMIIKTDKIVLKLKKKDPKSSVFSLYKQKMIGEIPSDEEKKAK